MPNRMQAFIEKLQAKPDPNEMDEKMLELMLQKQAELGQNPSPEEVDNAMRQVTREHLRFALRRKRHASCSGDGDERPTPSTTEALAEEIAVVRGVFQEMEVRFRDFPHQPDVYAFELGIRESGKVVRMKVFLENNPKVCRIDAVYPFTADQVFAYPLCEKLMEEQYPRLYGALQYDARDGDLSYRYSFPITHGLHSDDFQTIFLTVVKSAMASFDTVHQYASGRFRQDIRHKILDCIRKLLNELA